MSYACTKHKIVICDCYGNKVLDLESRLAEREKELRNANRGAETNFKMTDLALKEKAVIQKKAERYREALEKFTDLACGDHESHDPHGWAKAALGEKRHLERRDEGEGA